MRRLVLLRLVSMAALAVSALLTYDALHPDRAFCPFVEACEEARKSALGQIFGLPTSVVGLMAFGGLFLLTLLPPRWSWRLLKPAGLLAALAGGVFFGYQALMLESYCPLCLVADGAGLLCGVITLTWRGSAKRPARSATEGGPSRVAWLLAAVLAVVLPFAWPRETRPAYIDITPEGNMFDDEPTEGTAPPPVLPEGPGASSTLPRPPTAPPLAPPSRLPPGSRQGIPPRPSDAPTLVPPPAPAVPVPANGGSASRPPPVSTPATPAGLPPPAPPQPDVTIVEYLNAYCPHCRATHARLEKVIAESGARVRRRRVYTWATNDYPAWARACALAQTQGLEERMFEELLRSRSPDVREVQAAAQRAGLDPQALAAALRDPTPPPRLVKDRELFSQARLQGLPTLDIGRRRLMGEQSEAELRAAIEAARALPAPPR